MWFRWWRSLPALRSNVFQWNLVNQVSWFPDCLLIFRPGFRMHILLGVPVGVVFCGRLWEQFFMKENSKVLKLWSWCLGNPLGQGWYRPSVWLSKVRPVLVASSGCLGDGADPLWRRFKKECVSRHHLERVQSPPCGWLVEQLRREDVLWGKRDEELMGDEATRRRGCEPSAWRTETRTRWVKPHHGTGRWRTILVWGRNHCILSWLHLSLPHT